MMPWPAEKHFMYYDSNVMVYHARLLVQAPAAAEKLGRAADLKTSRRHTHTDTQTQTHTHTHRYTDADTHTDKHTHTHAHRHTHTLTAARPLGLPSVPALLLPQVESRWNSGTKMTMPTRNPRPPPRGLQNCRTRTQHGHVHHEAPEVAPE